MDAIRKQQQRPDKLSIAAHLDRKHGLRKSAVTRTIDNMLDSAAIYCKPRNGKDSYYIFDHWSYAKVTARSLTMKFILQGALDSMMLKTFTNHFAPQGSLRIVNSKMVESFDLKLRIKILEATVNNMPEKIAPAQSKCDREEAPAHDELSFRSQWDYMIKHIRV